MFLIACLKAVCVKAYNWSETSEIQKIAFSHFLMLSMRLRVFIV